MAISEIISEISNLAEVIGSLLSALSLIIGVIVFYLQIKRDKAKHTLNYWEQINQELKEEKRLLLNDYGTEITEDDAQEILESDNEDHIKINKILNMYERLALGVNIKAYDIKVLNRIAGGELINSYKRFKGYIIIYNKQDNTSILWIEFQKLYDRLEVIRKIKNKEKMKLQNTVVIIL